MNAGFQRLRRGILLAVLLAPLAPAPPAMESPVPFRAGETLNYRVAWSAFSSAASLQLSVPEQRNFFGRETWHLRATAHTLKTVRSLFTIDDQSDSYSDTTTFESRQFELHLNELGRKQDEILHFAPTGKASLAQGPIMAVPPGTYDPLGALYALRGVDWQHVQEFHITVCDGHDVYEISARLDASNETIAVDAGNFTTNRISIHVYQHGKEVTGDSDEVWLADDPARTPVRMQAQLPLGSIRAELIRATQ